MPSRPSILYAILFAAILTGGCATGPPPRTDRRAEGPARIVPSRVEDHAAQFDEDVPERKAGSQQELAAAAYITGHLQRAGYTMRLDSVPVGNLVRSTNVVAIPPSGGDPEVVVAVAYDTAPGVAPAGHEIGLFLELARALSVRSPGHSVEFVALGAEHASVKGGPLGTRRLVKVLLDRELRPPIVYVATSSGTGFSAAGTDVASPLRATARALKIAKDGASAGSSGSDELLDGAGFEHAFTMGGVEDMGEVLLEWLSERAG